MVNSGSFDSTDGNRNGKTRCTQAGDAAIGPSSGSDDTACKSGCSKSADGDLPSDESAIEPTPTKTEINSNMSDISTNDGKSIDCSRLPNEKTQSISLSDNSEDKAKHTRKLLCLYCDRSFVSVNLRQKHVERVHSVKQTRRVSARRQNQLSTTPCVHCDKLNSSEHTLNDLFQHLVQEHPAKYFGCLSCEERFLTFVHLADHHKSTHFAEDEMQKIVFPDASQINNTAESSLSAENVSKKVTRSKLRNKIGEPSDTQENSSVVKRKKKSKLKELRNKKITVKTSKIAIKRSKRLQQQAKDDSQKKRREKKFPNPSKPEISSNTKQLEKSKPSCVNPYPEFDSFYRVKKITDHSIDNLKISSLTFDDVFDKAFFNRIKCNIEENLLHHIDGKLFKNEESESRISNFEKIFTATQEVSNSSADNYGCELSLNAITPAPSLSLSSQFGEDFESQIEYGSKPSKKKTQIKSDEVHYKYFTRRKYQASILQQKKNRDLSKLDMWTQMVVKERQEKVLNKKKSAKEMQEYTSGQEYKSKIKRQELNRILDRRGPFEDLKEEASKKAAFDKLNSFSDSDISQEVFSDVTEVLDDLLNRVLESVEQDDSNLEVSSQEIDQREIPAYLDLRRKTSSSHEEIDKSDKIALICSSQETENFELPTNTVRAKNELVELTGEWARSRMYICAACGGKFSNMKYLLEHKSLYHQNVWVQHYEFVGNQSELYRHLNIPGLGKVGIVENTIPCKMWKRSDARTCTKCGRQCNSLGELHRHVLECGGDWTWMLARKKCKYRPYGAKARRKFSGFEPKIHNKRKTEPSEKKIYKKLDGPRQRPSDADTIQRMLANLPAKRSRRSIMSLSDVVFKSRKTKSMPSTQKHPTSKVKCGKKVHTKPQAEAGKTNSNQQRAHRALRSLNKVLSSRILDLNSSLLVKRKMKAMRNQRITRNTAEIKHNADITSNYLSLEESLIEPQSATLLTQKKRKSLKKDTTKEEESKPLITSSVNKNKKSVTKRMLTSHLNLKNFFPVKKKNLRVVQDNFSFNKISSENETNSNSNKKSEYLENFEHMKKKKRGGLKGFVRALSLRKRNSNKEECLAITDIALKDEQVQKLENSKKSHGRAKTKQILPLSKVSEQNIQHASSTEDINQEVLSKKRKIQRSFRNVISKVKKIKPDKNANKPTENTHVKTGKEENQAQPFLEETPLQKDITPTEKLVTLAEVKENIQEKEEPVPIATSLTESKENLPIPDTIFNLVTNDEEHLQAKCELDFDVKQNDLAESKDLSTGMNNLDIETSVISTDFDSKTTPVTIDTSLKPKCVPLISPNLKGKIRKPSRGLNDCIAMLTSKLQQKDEKMSSSLESLFSTSSTTSIEPRAESRPLLDSFNPVVKIPDPGSIPKIPVFSISQSPVIEETALDLSKKSFSTPNLYPNCNDNDIGGSIFENKNKDIFNDKIVASSWTSVDDIIQQVVQSSASYVFSKPKKKFATRTNVDDTIDSVVNNSLDWFENKHSDVKPKQKSKRKKHSDDNLITNILFGKDKLIIAPGNSINGFEDPLIAKIKENEYKMSRHLLNSTKANSENDLDKTSILTDLSKAPPSENILSVMKPYILLDKTKQSDDMTLAQNALIENGIVNPLVSSIDNESELNKATNGHLSDINMQPDNQAKPEIKNDYTLENNVNGITPSIKKVTDEGQVQTRQNLENDSKTVSLGDENENSTETEPKVNTPVQKTDTKTSSTKVPNRRRERLRKNKSQDKSEKSIIEKNMDDCMNIKEISCDKLVTTMINTFPDSQTIKSIDIQIELRTEDEPVVLENKIVEKLTKLPSDSEDDVPLAVIAKLDGVGSFRQNVDTSTKANKNVALLKNQHERDRCPPDSLNDAKDMVDTLTTDSLKENVEETINKNDSLANTINELTVANIAIPNVIKTITKKKRKKVMSRNKKAAGKKSFAERNSLDFPNFAAQEESEAALKGCISIKTDDHAKTSKPERLFEVSRDTESPNLQTTEPTDVESKVPVKLLSSQRTRRKSKSSKKIDKIDNDLFKDFSLVINKKTKRIPPMSIVDDSVCDDILDTNIKYLVKPAEIREETETKSADVISDSPLNDSVEEMDMEIEDIPINTSIIERDDKQLATLVSCKKETLFVTDDEVQNPDILIQEKEPFNTKMLLSEKESTIFDSNKITDSIKTNIPRIELAYKQEKVAEIGSLPQDISCTSAEVIPKSSVSIQEILDLKLPLRGDDRKNLMQDVMDLESVNIPNPKENIRTKLDIPFSENITKSSLFSEDTSTERSLSTNTTTKADPKKILECPSEADSFTKSVDFPLLNDAAENHLTVNDAKNCKNTQDVLEKVLSSKEPRIEPFLKNTDKTKADDIFPELSPLDKEMCNTDISNIILNEVPQVPGSINMTEDNPDVLKKLEIDRFYNASALANKDRSLSIIIDEFESPLKESTPKTNMVQTSKDLKKFNKKVSQVNTSGLTFVQTPQKPTSTTRKSRRYKKEENTIISDTIVSNEESFSAALEDGYINQSSSLFEVDKSNVNIDETSVSRKNLSHLSQRKSRRSTETSLVEPVIPDVGYSNSKSLQDSRRADEQNQIIDNLSFDTNTHEEQLDVNSDVNKHTPRKQKSSDDIPSICLIASNNSVTSANKTTAEDELNENCDVSNKRIIQQIVPIKHLTEEPLDPKTNKLEIQDGPTTFEEYFKTFPDHKIAASKIDENTDVKCNKTEEEDINTQILNESPENDRSETTVDKAYLENQSHSIEKLMEDSGFIEKSMEKSINKKKIAKKNKKSSCRQKKCSKQHIIENVNSRSEANDTPFCSTTYKRNDSALEIQNLNEQIFNDVSDEINLSKEVLTNINKEYVDCKTNIGVKESFENVESFCQDASLVKDISVAKSPAKTSGKRLKQNEVKYINTENLVLEETSKNSVNRRVRKKISEDNVNDALFLDMDSLFKPTNEAVATGLVHNADDLNKEGSTTITEEVIKNLDRTQINNINSHITDTIGNNLWETEMCKIPDSSVIASDEINANEVPVKARRSRKIIDYNEDNLEKRAIEMNTKVHNQPNKDLSAQTKKNKRLRKNAISVQEDTSTQLNEFATDKSIENIRHEDLSQTLNMSEFPIQMEIGRSTDKPNSEQFMITDTKQHKKRNKQKSDLTCEVAEINNRFNEGSERCTIDKAFENEFFEVKEQPMVFKVSEYSEMPKLVVDIHHTEQINKMLKEHVAQTISVNIKSHNLEDKQGNQNIQQEGNCYLTSFDVKSDDIPFYSKSIEIGLDSICKKEVNEKANKNIDRNTKNQLEIDNGKPADLETNVNFDNEVIKEATFLVSNGSKEESKEKQLEHQYLNNILPNSFKKSKKKKTIANKNTDLAEEDKCLTDIENGKYFDTVTRYNRRSRKAINYNEEVLLDTAQSLSSTNILEKKNKKKCDKFLNDQQNMMHDEEKSEAEPTVNVINNIKKKPIGKMFEDSNIAEADSEATKVGPEPYVSDFQLKNLNYNFENDDVIHLETQDNINDENIAYSEPIKDIFEFQENVSNEDQGKKSQLLFEKTNKKFSKQISDTEKLTSKTDIISSLFIEENVITEDHSVEEPMPNENSDQNDITSRAMNSIDANQIDFPLALKNIEINDTVSTITKCKKSVAEKRVKKQKKNNMDIDVANILDSETDSRNRRSPRKRKTPAERSDTELEKIIAEDSPQENTHEKSHTDNFFLTNKNDQHFMVNMNLNTEIKLDEASENLQNHISKDYPLDESQPLLERAKDLQNKLAIKDNICNNLLENDLPQKVDTSEKCIIDGANSSKDSLPIISVSDSDSLFKPTDSCVIIDDKIETILETKSLSSSIKTKKRKTKKEKLKTDVFCENQEEERRENQEKTEILLDEPKYINTNQALFDQPDRQYQLAKINIKDLLLSSLAPPDSTYMESGQIPLESGQLPSESSRMTNMAESLIDKHNIDEVKGKNSDINAPKSHLKPDKIKSKKQKVKCKNVPYTQENYQTFKKNLPENVQDQNKSNKSITSKNLSFTTLKNVLSTFTKSNKKDAFINSDSVFSEIPPLTEIITSSEMDIAPVLDEIDKSLESDDIYDFSEEAHHEADDVNHTSLKNKSKSRSKFEAIKDQSLEEHLEKDFNRRTSNRFAKVKALENIHEKVLTESGVLEDISTVQSKKSKKRSKSLNNIKTDISFIENESAIDYGKEQNTLIENADEVVDVRNISSKQCESDLLNKIENVSSSSNTLSKDQTKSNKDSETDISINNSTIHNQDLNQYMNSTKEIPLSEKTDQNQTDSDGLELRRSRRGSRKVASYNENDLIDPLIDALENRRNRSKKDKLVEKHQVKIDASKQIASDKPKLSSEELFDLLKKSSYENENIVISKPRNSFFDDLKTTSSNDAYQNISDMSDDDANINEKSLHEVSCKLPDADKIYEFTEESPENTGEIKELFGKKKKSKQSTEVKATPELSSCIENITTVGQVTSSLPEKSKACDQEKPNYCDICKKSFIRAETLVKHKTTLTHISKLSELEAREAEEKAKLEKQAIEDQSNSSLKAIETLKDDINITDILQQTERSQVSVQRNSPTLHSNHSLKLVDIISDVLNKPVLEKYNHDKQEFSTTSILGKEKSDIRRYKSLGERKSFESEAHLSQINATSYIPATLSQTTILEKQINLLENIIGNNLDNITANKPESEKNFIDEISSCSNTSNISDLDNSCHISRFNTNSENVEANSDADFVKPTQYEEISEDSASARVYDDPKQRKTLNRDEELFLECCSLLKSGSEVSNSNYSKNAKKPLEDLKEIDEPEFTENRDLIQTAEGALEYSDNSRTPTPLGDTYDDEASNSNTISSNWHLNSEKPLDKNRSFSFEEVKNKEAAGMTFGEILTKGLKNQFENIDKTDDRSNGSFQDLIPDGSSHNDERKDDSDSSTTSKKITTKGARKVYEGLKVSIPTEDLNLDVLNTSPLNKISETKTISSPEESLKQARAKPRSTRKSKPVKKSQVGSNLLFKVNKKKSSSQMSNSTPAKQDIYNFEETQDNTDIFIKPVFKEIKNTMLDTKKDAIISSDNESLGYADSIGADAKSVSSVSSISAISAKKPEVTPENITKKKYKIMGKIFRNAAKPKLDDIDEELRSIPEIPEIDNLELVENYVRSCQRVKSPFMPPLPPPPLDEIPKKPKMTEEEMNMIFDQLLGKDINESKPEKLLNKPSSVTKPKAEPKSGDTKKKTTRVKNRKRARGNSESSDDEFNINRTAKKRTNKKNNQDDSGINLELELKECIGVASRKSQRTCTSGKQNILLEYWSSDEEAFEAMLENHKIATKKEDEKKVEKKKTEIDESVNKPETTENRSDKPVKPKPIRKKAQAIKKPKPNNTKQSEVNAAAVAASNRRKRAAANPLYHWSSSSEDESESLIEIKPIREEDDEEDRPIQHGWIVGDSPKKLVTMLALTKGKKTDIDSVKEQGKRRSSNTTS